MSHKKAGGSSKNNRDSKAKRRGVKVYGDQTVKAGGIIVRQKGTKFHAGDNVGMGRDFSLFSKIDGIVKYRNRKRKKYDGRVFVDKIVEVVKK